MIGSPNVTATRKGVNASALPSSPLSSTGISSTRPAQPLGVRGGDLESGVGAERGAHHDRLLDAEVVHKRDDLARRRSPSSSATCRAAVRAAVAEQVHRDHAVAARGELFGERPVHLLGEQQPVQEDQRAPIRRSAARGPPAPAAARDLSRPSAVLGVGKALAVELEVRHRANVLPSHRVRGRSSPGSPPPDRPALGAGSAYWPRGQGHATEPAPRDSVTVALRRTGRRAMLRARVVNRPAPRRTQRRRPDGKAAPHPRRPDRGDHRRRARDRTLRPRRRDCVQGMKVVIGDLDAESARETAAQLGAPERVVALALDVTDRDSFAAFLDGAEERFGPLDVLVNNAGDHADRALHRRGRPDRATDDRYQPARGDPRLQARAGADGSARPRPHREHLLAGGEVRRAGGATYSATKHAVVGLTEAIRGELRLMGAHIDVSYVMPTWSTPNWARGSARRAG